MPALDTPAVDQQKLEAFVGQVVCEVGAVLNATLVVLGDRLGLYRALADGEPVDAATLAERTGTGERVVREWLNAQAAGGYVEYDAATGTSACRRSTPRCSPTSPARPSPAGLPARRLDHQGRAQAARGLPRRRRVGWHEHHHDLFEGCERFFRPGYDAHLVATWLPALDGVEERLHAAAGSRTSAAATARRRSSWRGLPGVDVHRLRLPLRVRRGRPRARAPGRRRRTRASRWRRRRAIPARATTSSRCSTACTTWATRSARPAHVRETLADDGVWMIVEPYASDRVEENLNPVGRVYYGASALICTPCAPVAGGRAGARARRPARRASARCAPPAGSRASAARPRRP